MMFHSHRSVFGYIGHGIPSNANFVRPADAATNGPLIQAITQVFELESPNASRWRLGRT
jgi:hypothetical protein